MCKLWNKGFQKGVTYLHTNLITCRQRGAPLLKIAAKLLRYTLLYAKLRVHLTGIDLNVILYKKNIK